MTELGRQENEVKGKEVEEEKVGEWAENQEEGEGDTVTETSDVLQYNSNTSAVHFRLNTLSSAFTCFMWIVKLRLTATNFVIFLGLNFETTSTCPSLSKLFLSDLFSISACL